MIHSSTGTSTSTLACAAMLSLALLLSGSRGVMGQDKSPPQPPPSPPPPSPPPPPMTTYQATFRFVGAGAAAVTSAALTTVFADVANVSTSDVVVSVTHVAERALRLWGLADPATWPAERIASMSAAMSNATGGGGGQSGYTAKFITAGNAVPPPPSSSSRRLLTVTQTQMQMQMQTQTQTQTRRQLLNASTTPVPYAVMLLRSVHASSAEATAAAAALSTAATDGKLSASMSSRGLNATPAAGPATVLAEAAVWIELAWNQTSVPATFNALAATNFTAGGISGVNASVVDGGDRPCTPQQLKPVPAFTRLFFFVFF